MSRTPVAIILAGGANSRFWPLREKSLYHFMGESLLEKQLKVYADAGLEDVIIVANPGNQELITAALSALETDIVWDVVVQEKPMGMGHALLQAREKLVEKSLPPIYVCQVNDVVEPDLHKRMFNAYKSKAAQSYMAGYQVESYFPGGYLSVDDNNRITGIVEKPGAGNEPSDLINIVSHIHTDTKRLFEEIQKLYNGGHGGDDHYEVAMAAMMTDQVFQCVRYDSEWYPIKYPWHVLDVTRFYLEHITGQHISEEARINGEVKILGNVYIEPGAMVFHGASIVGPAYIGAGAIVGNGALVRESMIGAGSVVGHVSEVARSYIGQRVNLHRAVVLDSVFEDDTNFSAGCITANLRIDYGAVKSTVKGKRISSGRDKLGAIVGAGAFIGIQSGTMPGVKIGPGAEVGAFTNVTEDVQAGERIFSVQEVHRVSATGKASQGEDSE